LDLLKNHIFREAGQQNQTVMQSNWTRLLTHLGDGKSDLFLKAFWTSRYGRIQRGRLFHELKKNIQKEHRFFPSQANLPT
jgi:hypothetical protein